MPGYTRIFRLVATLACGVSASFNFNIIILCVCMRVSRHEATFLQAEHAARKRRYHSPAKSGHSIKKKRKKESSKNWGTCALSVCEITHMGTCTCIHLLQKTTIVFN
jgi:hypothetical protein